MYRTRREENSGVASGKATRQVGVAGMFVVAATLLGILAGCCCEKYEDPKKLQPTQPPLAEQYFPETQKKEPSFWSKLWPF